MLADDRSESGQYFSRVQPNNMAKQVLFHEDARRALAQGLDMLAQVVAITLGPKGRNVVIGQLGGMPKIINDGVTIAKEIELADPVANAGVALLRQAASKTNDFAGDGTTTAIVLAHALVTEGLKNVTAGANPVALKRGMDKATIFLVKAIAHQASPIDGFHAIAQIGSIAAGNDDDIGDMIAKAMEKVGKDGVISLEEGQSMVTDVEITEGMRFNKGYLSPYFVTDPERMESVMDNPLILITDQTITNVQDLIPLLEKGVSTGQSLVLIAADIKQEALATMVMNGLQGIIRITAVKAPGFGDRRRELLEDIAVLTGGTVMVEAKGLQLDQVSLDQLGTARRVVVTQEDTTLVVVGHEKPIQTRCAQIRQQIEGADSAYDQEKLKERLARLAGGIALIKVGAATETEMLDRKLRLEDALNATKAAVESGIIPGGGITLAHLAPSLESWARETLNDEELTGALIVAKSLTAPLQRIAENAGQNGAVIVERIKDQAFSVGYNAATNTIVDLFLAGIVDPAKVTTSALQNATSIAGMVLMTECVVTQQPTNE